jgi:hypothetical protein
MKDAVLEEVARPFPAGVPEPRGRDHRVPRALRRAFEADCGDPAGAPAARLADRHASQYTCEIPLPVFDHRRPALRPGAPRRRHRILRPAQAVRAETAAHAAREAGRSVCRLPKATWKTSWNRSRAWCWRTWKPSAATRARPPCSSASRRKARRTWRSAAHRRAAPCCPSDVEDIYQQFLEAVREAAHRGSTAEDLTTATR